MKLNQKFSLKFKYFILFFIITFSSVAFSQKCACGATGTNICSPEYSTTQAAAETNASNGVLAATIDISSQNLRTDNGETHKLCYEYTTKSTETKIGFRFYIGTPGGAIGSPTYCNETRTISISPTCGGTSLTPTITTAKGFNEYTVTPSTKYNICVTSTFDPSDTDCDEIDPSKPAIIKSIELYMYNATPSTPPSGCTSTIGTVAVTGATANGSEWDVNPSATLTLTATGFILPTSSSSPCVATYGYVVFDQAPTLPITNISTLNTMSGYKGISTGNICTDVNDAGKSNSVSTASKLWYVPLTLDCKKGSDNKIHIDNNSDACYAIGTTAIIVNYLVNMPPPIPCGTCTTPNCPIGNMPTYLDRFPSGQTGCTASATTNCPGQGAQVCQVGLSMKGTEITYQTVTADGLGNIGAFVQSVKISTLGTYTLTSDLYEITDCNGVAKTKGKFSSDALATGTALNVHNRSAGNGSWNPEWTGLVPGKSYILKTTFNVASGDVITEYCMDFYGLKTTPPCPVDQTFIQVDWAQTNPFLPFPSTTYTCASGPQTIWKNVEDATISTGGELQAFPGFFMELTTDANSGANTSALVTVNGVPYSYYGPTGTAPPGVIYFGPMAVPPDYQNIIEPFLPAGATVIVTIKDSRSGSQSFPYTIFDHSTGVTLKSGTATPNSLTPIPLTFTLSSPTMTWKLDGGVANIIDNNNGSATFNPSNLTTGQHIIKYTWTNNALCTITAEQTIDVGATTVGPTTSPIAYCQDAATSALSVTPTPGCTLNWYGTSQTGGTASPAPTPNSTTPGATTYYVSQTNTSTSCESPRTPLVVTINAKPIITPSSVIPEVCEGTTSANIPYTTTSTGTNIPSTYTLDWNTASDAAGFSDITTYTALSASPLSITLPATAAIGTYNGSLTVKNAAGCEATTPISVKTKDCTVLTCPEIKNPTAAFSFCSGDLPTNSLEVESPNKVKYFYSTTKLTTASGILNSGVNLYTIATNPLGTSTTAGTKEKLILTSTSFPTNTSSSSIDYYVYAIFDDVSTLDASCRDFEEIKVTVNALPVLTINNPASVCLPLTIDITNSLVTLGSTGNGTLSYYTDVATTIVLTNPSNINVAGIYYIKSTNVTCTDTKPVTVTFSSGSSLIVTNPAEVCQPATVNITDPKLISGGSTGAIITYCSNSAGTILLTSPNSIRNSGTYYIKSTQNGCSTVVPIIVKVNPKPKANFVPTPPNVTTIDSKSIMLNTSLNAVDYSWIFSDGTVSSDMSPEHEFPNKEQSKQVVILIATSDAGCKDTTNKIINVNEEVIYYIPNTFTPDDDDFNQVFKPVFTSGFDPSTYHLEIFNRWGELVFESNDTEIGWAGLYGKDGVMVQEGSYTWKIDFKLKENDTHKIEVGNVNILK